jgi:hypothetical protein
MKEAYLQIPLPIPCRARFAAADSAAGRLVKILARL